MAEDNRTIQQLLAESKRLSELADKIRQKMDAVTEEIAKRAAASEDGNHAATPPPWSTEKHPPKI